MNRHSHQNKVLLLLVCLFSFNANALELFYGQGDSFEADQSGESFYSISLREKRWEIGLTYWEEYNKTSWWERHPEWRRYTEAVTPVPSHTMLSATYEIYEYQFSDEFKFFVDFGFTLVDNVSHVNSSHVLFKEHIGIEYGMVRLSWTHSSNAGLKGRNNGEDGLHLQIKLWEWR